MASKLKGERRLRVIALKFAIVSTGPYASPVGNTGHGAKSSTVPALPVIETISSVAPGNSYQRGCIRRDWTESTCVSTSNNVLRAHHSIDDDVVALNKLTIDLEMASELHITRAACGRITSVIGCVSLLAKRISASIVISKVVTYVKLARVA